LLRGILPPPPPPPLFHVFHVNIYYIRLSQLKIFASSIPQLMEKRGYGEDYISRYKMMTGYSIRVKGKTFLYSIHVKEKSGIPITCFFCAHPQLQVPSSKSTAGNISVRHCLYRKINNRHTTCSKAQFTKCFAGLFSFSTSLIVHLCFACLFQSRPFNLIADFFSLTITSRQTWCMSCCGHQQSKVYHLLFFLYRVKEYHYFCHVQCPLCACFLFCPKICAHINNKMQCSAYFSSCVGT
jgi:hypothetical protein